MPKKYNNVLTLFLTLYGRSKWMLDQSVYDDHFFNIWQFKTMPILAIGGSEFCQIFNKPLKLPKNLYYFAKVARFRQIWSYW